MNLRDISFPNPQDNIAFDEVLWLMAEKYGAGEFLRFWESPQVFIVLGRIGREDEDINLDRACQDNVPVLRRCSGGGTVVQGPGCLNYTLVLSKQKHFEINDLRQSYQWISARVIEALKKAGVEAYFRPLSDLAMGGFEQKFSGNAQRRGRQYIMHHGTILYNFELSLISRYLKMPQDIPEYRNGRDHKDFVTNVNLDPELFKRYLALAFVPSQDCFDSGLQLLSSQELTLLKKFR
ncbi:MAG: lipoate--protein ligase family protein [Candidatus Omnitrophica bacterium]|nr:lipoate--protein ligase family protein [Candidatus Omnitrophota bacterium]